MSNIDCPYKLAGICMNSVSMHFDEACCPGFCIFHNQIAEKGEADACACNVRR